MPDQSVLEIYAKHFYNLGLNVTTISNERNEYNFLDNNLYKAPCHEWQYLEKERQYLVEIESFNWQKAIGLGVVLGYENLMALDIDGVVDFDFISTICEALNVDKDYPWIIKSGSGCGFHLLFICDDFVIDKQLIEKRFATERWELVEDFGYGDVNAYYPKHLHHNGYYKYGRDFMKKHFTDCCHLRDIYQKIEFRWKGHLVLPESLHQSGRNYKFFNNLPINRPEKISFEVLKRLKEIICAEKADSSSYDAKRELYTVGDDKLMDRMPGNESKFLIFDTETNGFPIDFKGNFSVCLVLKKPYMF